MAKHNKYWGLVAVGAATATVAGAVAALLMKKKAEHDYFDLDDDFDDEFDDADEPEASEEKESQEDFVSWETADSETDTAEPDEEDASGETSGSEEDSEPSGYAEDNAEEEKEPEEPDTDD